MENLIFSFTKIVRLLFNALNSADFTSITSEISGLLNAESVRILKLMSNTIYSYLKFETDFFLGTNSKLNPTEEVKDLADEIPHIRSETVSDEFVIKKQGQLKKIKVAKETLEKKNYYDEFLVIERNISQISSKIIKFADENEDCRLSFSVYDGFKQFADNNLGKVDLLELNLYEPESLF